MAFLLNGNNNKVGKGALMNLPGPSSKALYFNANSFVVAELKSIGIGAVTTALTSFLPWFFYSLLEIYVLNRRDPKFGPESLVKLEAMIFGVFAACISAAFLVFAACTLAAFLIATFLFCVPPINKPRNTILIATIASLLSSSALWSGFTTKVAAFLSWEEGFQGIITAAVLIHLAFLTGLWCLDRIAFAAGRKQETVNPGRASSVL